MSEAAPDPSARTVEVYVAAGSNVAPVTHLQRALAELGKRFSNLRVSTAYQNPAVGFSGDDFINLVVGFTTSLDIPGVLRELQVVEGLCGRRRSDPKWAPRSMDLDLLLYGDVVGEFPGAVLPRPDLLKRPYMLGPLAELAPGLVHPVLRQSIGALWSGFAGHDVLRPVVLA